MSSSMFPFPKQVGVVLLALFPINDSLSLSALPNVMAVNHTPQFPYIIILVDVKRTITYDFYGEYHLPSTFYFYNGGDGEERVGCSTTAVEEGFGGGVDGAGEAVGASEVGRTGVDWMGGVWAVEFDGTDGAG